MAAFPVLNEFENHYGLVENQIAGTLRSVNPCVELGVDVLQLIRDALSGHLDNLVSEDLKRRIAWLAETLETIEEFAALVEGALALIEDDTLRNQLIRLLKRELCGFLREVTAELTSDVKNLRTKTVTDSFALRKATVKLRIKGLAAPKIATLNAPRKFIQDLRKERENLKEAEEAFDTVRDLTTIASDASKIVSRAGRIQNLVNSL